MIGRHGIVRQGGKIIRIRQRHGLRPQSQHIGCVIENHTLPSNNFVECDCNSSSSQYQPFSRIHVRSFSLLPPPPVKEETNKLNPVNNNKGTLVSILPIATEAPPKLSRKHHDKRKRSSRTSSTSRRSQKPDENGAASGASTRTRRRRRPKSKQKPDEAPSSPSSSADDKEPLQSALPTNPRKIAIRLNAKMEQELQDWYEKHHGVSFKETCISLKRVQLDSLGMWKANFACPITAEVFACGTLETLSEHAKEHNGEIMYSRMAAARAAAVARALDCYRYREQQQSSHDLSSKCCLEQPYAFGDAPSLPKAVAIPAVDANLQLHSDDEEEEEDEESEDDDYFYIGEEDDEEYTIQYLPGSIQPSDVSRGVVANPMARVIGDWMSQTHRKQRTNGPVAHLIFAPDPETELQHQIENARTWINHEQSKNYHGDSNNKQEPDEHRVMLQAVDSPHSLEIAYSILNGLAQANRRVAWQDKPRGVDDIATRIVRYLWSTTSAQPNASTYVAYLGCLEGPSPLDVAMRAKLLLDNMNEEAPADVTGEKFYPKPSIGVVNAVIQLWAQVGGESGRFSLDNIDNPNRETFLSVLSSMCYPATVEGEFGGFDPIFAQDVFDKMKLLADQNPTDGTLQPDIQCYNAGLRWSGGLQSTLSRPHMRAVPWDSHAEIFRNGFLPFNEDCQAVQDAYRMNAWLEEMMTLDSVNPNIETYEAVIQAYIRTGTKNGVKQAEALLNSLIGTSSLDPKPRAQTFHPVIAAWAYSGHKDGPQNVNKWIGLMEACVEESDSDLRLLEAPLIANATRVVRRMEETKELSESDSFDLVEIAHDCSASLADLCAILRDEKHQDGVSITLHSNMFVFVLQVWGLLVGRFLERPDGAEDAKQTLQKMYETVTEYEALIASLHTSPASASNRAQVSHLMDAAHEVYSLLSTTLGNAKPFVADWMLEQYLVNVEKWVRRVGEFNRIQSSKSKRNSALVHGDMYSYGYLEHKALAVPESSAGYFMLVLKTLQDDVDVVSTHRRGDMIRLCMLIMRVLPFISNDLNPQLSLSATYKEVVRTVCQLARSPNETEALLWMILNQVEWLQGQQPSFKIDRGAIVKEMRKLCPSLPANYERRNRSRNSRRSGFGRPFRRTRSGTPPRRSSSTQTNAVEDLQ